ncbi:predicted glutamine amidotransferase [Corynebacterium kutscheri]|uniref:pyridoxal 5'-phosphate synthase glutaminase subunit PdxT n=1 Tax=Corynebacterium kutscheri TaxID=35755 RepID=UPI000F716BE0|nr:pyridoxal 5'-phosphate synthase glutaminase subunit PdxT [Corynebacterium kutscheri]VEH82542.1 predicted glutamine amidotransferase [Corynebacterium kutscheri]
MLIGILGLQGGIEEHEHIFHRLSVSTRRVRTPADLAGLDGLVLPGGESSVMAKLAEQLGLFNPLQKLINDGLPVFATCAGLILLATKLDNPAPGQKNLAVVDMVVRRNAFGNQRNSFEHDLEVLGVTMRPTFIRAPEVISVGAGIDVIAKIDGRIVGVKQDKILGLSFHPEQVGDYRLHQLWLEEIL